MKCYFSNYIYFIIIFLFFSTTDNTATVISVFPEINSCTNHNQDYYCKPQQPSDIIYSIEPFYDFNEMRLIVVLEFKGDKSGETKIMLPNNFSGNHDINGIKYLKVLSPNSYILDTDNADMKLIKHVPNADLKIYYQVCDIRDGDLDAQNYLMTIINKQYFHFFGETFFIVPIWNNGEEVNFRLSWSHLPYNWTFINSFGINENFQEFKAPIWKFLHSAFAGGDFTIKRRFIGQDQIYTAVRGRWKFPEDQLCDIIRDISIEERNFWNDHNYPYFLVIVLPLNVNNNQCGKSHSNSLSLFLSADRSIDFKLKQIIAHETFHSWLGEKINFSQPELLLYWFKEGFCDYYTRLILLRASLISLSEYAEDYNNVLEQYFTSSVRYEKNDGLLNEFWNNSDWHSLPYLRGDIIAHNLNSVIMINSGWKKSLDDLMRDLLKRTQNESLVVSNGSLIALIRFYAGEAPLADIMRVLNSGTILRVNPDALGSAFNIEQNSRRKFWLFGELYEIPIYIAKDPDHLANKDLLLWFGIQ